jgi:hypothetical protein
LWDSVEEFGRETGQFLILRRSWIAGSVGGMARKLRVEYPGAVYHVMNRGDRRKPILRYELIANCFLDAARFRNSFIVMANAIQRAMSVVNSASTF